MEQHQQKACLLGLRSPCAVEEVAGSVGFSDGDDFRRAFERCFRVALREYRGKICDEGREAKVASQELEGMGYPQTAWHCEEANQAGAAEKS